MRTFKEFKQDVVENFEENYSEYYEKEISQLKESVTFNELSEILVGIGFWEMSDAIDWGKEIVQ